MQFSFNKKHNQNALKIISLNCNIQFNIYEIAEIPF
jgi:hypothetical protein